MEIIPRQSPWLPVITDLPSLLNSCVVLLTLNFLLVLNSNSICLCLDTKYFKRFYFGNLSVDLTDELGERFNYDYLPPSTLPRTPTNQNTPNAYHIHGSKNIPPPPSSSSHQHHNPYNSDRSEPLLHHPHNTHVLADQPSNATQPPQQKPTSPPPPSNNQPYRHQDLKALSRNITNILNSFNISYDKRVRPNYGGEAVEVGITMFVLSISDLSEVEMDFTLDFYFRQMWKDNRLTFNGPKGVNTLSVSSEFLKSMWVPDTFFVNEKTSYFHTATTNNEFLRISQTGDILRSMRLTVCASCPMDLRHFPMDSQLCNIEIESFGYTMSDIRYKWAAGPGSVGMANDVSLPQFKVYGYRQKTYEISLSTGNYSRLACEIQFVRSMGYYLIQIYIPSSLIVVISWVSFWLNRNAAPARVYLGITTVLTMTTLMSSTNKALPKISYVKSIDVYLGTCFVMVFAALLEYATVGYLAKRIQMRKNHFAALQKMALQLQTARDEHIQKQYAPTTSATTPVLPHAPPPQQQPTTPHHHAPSNPQTPHTPRYNPPQQTQQHPDHYPQQTPSSTRFFDSGSSTLRKYTNNAQFISSHHQQQSSSAGGPQPHHGNVAPPQQVMGSNVSIPPGYYTPGAAPQQAQPPQGTRGVCYDSTGAARYYDAQVYDRGGSSGNAIQNTPHHHVHPQQNPYYTQQPTQQPQYYTREQSSWEQPGTGTASRGASVKRRGGSGIEPEMDASRYMIQQQGLPMGQGPACIPQQDNRQMYHHHQQAQAQAPQLMQTQSVHVGSVIGTTSIEQPRVERDGGGNPQTGDKIRQLIPINPNQICGITPSDIDKYSRVVFPVCFVCFNLLYWIIYLHISNVNPTPDLVIMNQEG